MAVRHKFELKQAMELAFRDYHHGKRSQLDPISLVYPFKDPKDREVVAFLVALIAYGNVGTILKSGEKLLTPLGASPFTYLINGGSLNLWPDFKHRFTRGVDIEIVSHWLRNVLREYGSIENCFIQASGPSTSPMKHKLSAFVKRMWAQPLPGILKPTLNLRKRNLKYLLSNPEDGSACKRLNMFLRWVVRPKDGVDLGLWKSIFPSELMLPLDTHLIQTLKNLKWIRTENTNWKTVEAVTEKLRSLSAQDPIRYDFALCHLSMSGGNFENYQKISRALEAK